MQNLQPPTSEAAVLIPRGTMSKQGRPPNQQPKTAFDCRRYLTLVQTLATDNPAKSIMELCRLWDVSQVNAFPTNGGRTYLNFEATVQKLARHVIEYHQNKGTADDP